MSENTQSHLRLRWIASSASIVLLVVAIPLTLSSCFPTYVEQPLPDTLKPGQYQVDGCTLTYIEAGTPGQLMLMLMLMPIHGTPGNWQAFRGFLQAPALTKHFHLIAVNRPGFGPPDQVPIQADMRKQAQYVAPLLEYGDHPGPAIVVGHSLVGTIAYQLAADYPDQVGSILPIAANVGPKQDQPRWFNNLANLPVIRWLVPRDLAKANIQIMPLSKDLQRLKSRLDTITIPVTVIHGSADKLVSADNLHFVREELREAELNVIEEPDAGHFILWEQPELVVLAAIELSGGSMARPPRRDTATRDDEIMPP